MAYHKLLQRQLTKFIGDDNITPENFQPLVEAINSAYLAFEKDKELSDHAFSVSQQEYIEINTRLKEEVELRKLSIQKLKSILSHFISDNKETFAEKDDNLLEIVDQLNDEMNRRKEVEQQLLLAKEEAEKASIAKSDFLSVISHEIRTPLNAVIGMGHLLHKNQPRPDQVENLNALRISADNLLVLINDILDFNKIEAGKLDLEEAPFSVKKLVKDIVRANTNGANERENGISLLIDDNIPDYLLGDSLRLGQVLNNLVSNAIKFTEKGFVSVRVDLAELNATSAVIKFSVIDTGVGIAPENLRGIFLPFMQASTSITRKYGGTGLGLAITRKILQLINSDIEVETKVGKGSKFFFSVELSIVATNPENPYEYDTIDFDLKQARILLAEDTMFNVFYATQLLESWNSRVEVAENGQIAVDMMKTGHYDLILMDLHMPVMDGYTATIKIREFNTTIPIVALTASVSGNVREKVIESGMQDYVTKPLNPDEFFIKVRKYLS